MNGKVRRFYEELAAMSGLRLDPEGGAPVSYTHLDVYKRQVWYRGSRRGAHSVRRLDE